MTYYETPGVLEDIAGFMVNYYNEEYLLKRYDKVFTKTNLMEYSHKIKQIVGSLPEELHPFAYSSDKTISFITSRTKEVDFATITFDSFVAYMRSDAFLHDFCHHWFNIEHEVKKIEDIESYHLKNLIPGLPHPENIKYKLHMVLSDFNRYREEFISTFIFISSYVLQLRDQYRELIDQSRERYDNVFFYQYIREIRSCEISDFKFTVTLMNSILLYFSTNKGILLIGAKAYTWICEGRESNLNTFSFIFNDPLRIKIIEFIHQNQPAAYSNVFQHFNEKRSVLIFQIDLLVEEGFINTKQYQDGRFYLTINQDYFKHIPKAFQKTFGLKDEKENQEA